MRTRRSNRTKSYAEEEYHFGDSSTEDDVIAQAPSNDEEEGANFENEAATEDPEEEDDEQNNTADEDNASEEDGISISESESIQTTTKPARRRAAKSEAGTAPQPPAPKGGGKTTKLTRGYLEIPLATQEGGHQPKTYIGPNDRAVRRHHLVSAWYGPDEERMETVQALLNRWFQWPVLPPRTPQGDSPVPSRGAWLDDYEGREAALAAAWRAKVEAAMDGCRPLRGLSPAEAAPYRSPTHRMPVLVGPSVTEEVFFVSGGGYALSQAGIPFEYDESDDKEPSGWILDTGGIVTSMDWAPRAREQTRQRLAAAVMPHADQEVHEFADEAAKTQFQSRGTVQLWEVQGDVPAARGSAMTTTLPPCLTRTLCFPHGRARRVRWNPIGGYLAVLCANGAVYVFEVDDEGLEEYVEELLTPVAVLCLRNEAGIDATAMSWASMNRLVVGYSDGSVALWSIFPCYLLSRHAVHHSHVVEIATGYPSMPYIVAATPLGGTMRILDLEAPSYEFTEMQSITVTTQPGLLAWSDQMLGFFSVYPSARVNNTVIGFMHHANFPLFRTTFTGDSFPSCIATGKTHPFLLIGLMDGSVWCINPQVEHFNSRSDATYRLRLFQHEHRPHHLFPLDSPAGRRGASRVVQGFEVEKNRNPRNDTQPATKKGKAAVKKKQSRVVENADEDGDDVLKSSDASRAAVHEPLTRITTMEWNPNDGYGCWAAMAMGSGLVRIMDLGIENKDNDE
ncbi:transcription factor TFIIIC complex subunit Tfc6, putative [Cordyceps militaris CM01]|uniref:Transcription factor TFIIIC complex subunit Tfc6, putative n=1 Tax=Cordyceps militaris (strain CM01) TaxID=983644 RepID=G3J5I3_CORMM|nr:transcription factor TFIIIC complex subunit Tfc6, putative [Cordyceps militaris CM01]EGX96044.1 transcription factor TFIIIC complex subunit Tfc6, putative [Cordyceps militaris CM01]